MNTPAFWAIIRANYDADRLQSMTTMARAQWAQLEHSRRPLAERVAEYLPKPLKPYDQETDA